MMNPRIATALLIPLLLIPMAGFSYAHWSDSVFKQYKMHYRCVETGIITYKLLSPWNDDLIEMWPSDAELETMGSTTTITFSTSIGPGWYVWIGFIIQNLGRVPVWIDAPTYDVNDTDNIWSWFNHEEYYYGQTIDGTSYGWPRNDVPKGLYDHVYVQSQQQMQKGKPLPPHAVPPPPPGDIPPPIYLEAYGSASGEHPMDSMITWIKLELDPDYPSEEEFGIEISVIITVTMA